MNDSVPEPGGSLEAAGPPSVRTVFGTLALSGCAVLVCLAFVDGTGGLPFSMPRSWYSHRAIWYFMILIAFVCGCLLLRHDGSARSDSGKRSRIRSRRLVLYTRQNCHLCDDALALLKVHQHNLPPIETVDVDSDPALVEKFDKCVPVVEIDGKLRFRGKINPMLLKRLIDHSPLADVAAGGTDGRHRA